MFSVVIITQVVGIACLVRWNITINVIWKRVELSRLIYWVLASLYTWRKEALARGSRPAPREIEVCRSELRQVAVGVWEERLRHPSAGPATIEAVRPVLQDWIGRRHGTLTFRLTQVLTGHGCFGRYLCRLGREPTSGCHHCDTGDEDTALHTLQECPA
ncbi:hypothetical protein K1T71_010234 [Dendrolimus kikuchii]|uniref:Uncharacterized protein n=1 Tax=Dendrolimus kikuchii TaxID=765133 RepID=A0ACC1CRA0_9NEOP|nr:hypothetical protein K1T71_010234 [Dendrolimus kikuchii]